ncbi:MAG: hypothetical protein RLZZ153_1048 [Pseudomonadota bacterium]|jgi:thimet oligopeptidase
MTRFALIRKSCVFASVGLFSAFASAQSAPVPAGLKSQLVPLLSSDDIKVQCPAMLTNVREKMKALEKRQDLKDARGVFTEWNAISVTMEDVAGPIYLANSLSPNPQVRNAAEACIIEIGKIGTEMMQSLDLYALVKNAKAFDPIDQRLQKEFLMSFEDSGVTGTPEVRAKLKSIRERLSRLSLEFAKTVRENKEKLAFTEAEVKGLPAGVLARLKKDAEGRYLFGFASTEYIPFMEYADSDDARRRYQTAYVNRGSARNLEVLKEILALRDEAAKITGYKTFAHYQVRNRMAKTPDRIDSFLAEVRQTAEEIEKRELDEIRAYMKAQGAKADLVRWNVAYWQRRLEAERYQVDQEKLRAYFPTQAAVSWALDISSKLYGLKFTFIDAPVWHESVRAIAVQDAATGADVGLIYLDLFPREGKYGHAAAFGTRRPSTLLGRMPTSVLVANFNPTGLGHQELVTLMHEFGHIFHGVLSKTRYVMKGGTAVERDFVEVPSQMYEEWAREYETLSMLSSHCAPGCPKIDQDLMKRITAANNFGRGLRYARQALYARYDMRLHTDTTGAVDPMAVWAQMEGASALGHVQSTQFPGQFGHIAGGYAAGYYSYLWSEVLAFDMYSQFKGKMLSPEIGRRYREQVLSRGGEVDGDTMAKSFLGRAPTPDAFNRQLKMGVAR